MKPFLKKLLLGNPSQNIMPSSNVIDERIRNIKAIWNNDHHEDIGIEKIVRLFLACSQFIFIGTYVKQVFSRKGVAYQELAVDCLVVLKVILPLVVLYCGYEKYNIFFFFIIWFLTETLLYVLTLIFASDLFSRPRSYRRAMLLLFFNYLEIVFSFAVMYGRGDYLNEAFGHWYDPVYFSFVISSTIGLGEYYPITPFGKLIVSGQSIIFFMFLVLFINFFTNKVESKGYFEHKTKE